jgi:hypothetical protein
MGVKDQRKGARYRVHLSVRYASAREFVVEYARNLSAGGLFIRGAQHLEPLSPITVEISLPGYKTVQVDAQVVHVITPEMAAGTDNKPGAGVAITQSPDGFDEAMSAYLQRLGRRRDRLVLVGDEACRELLQEAGYQTGPAPAVDELVAAIARSDVPVIGVVVSRAQEAEYTAAATKAGMPEVVRSIDYLEEIDELLTQLDAEL